MRTEDYKTVLQETLENLEKERINQNDYLIDNAEIEHLLDYINYLKQKNQQLKDNWIKLKEYIVKEYYMYLPLEASTKSITILINKMKEIEKGSNSNVKD